MTGGINIHPQQVSRTLIVFTLSENDHFNEYGFVLRPYSKTGNLYWFFTDFDYRGNERIFSTMVKIEQIKDVVKQHERQIKIDILSQNVESQ